MMAATVRPMIALDVSSQNGYVLKSAVTALGGWFDDGGGGDVICHVLSGATIGGVNSSSGTVSFDVGSFTNDKHMILILNDGNIDGKGGSGGAGGSGAGTNGAGGGTPQGTAFKTTVNVDFINNGNIRQAGGGGGGGGGAMWHDGKDCTNQLYTGGTGGNGAGNGVAATGGGGGVVLGGSGGAGGTWATGGAAGSAGTQSASCTFGTGGAVSSSSGFYIDGLSKTNFLVTGTRTGSSKN